MVLSLLFKKRQSSQSVPVMGNTEKQVAENQAEISNNSLEEAMIANLQNDTQDSRNRFFQELLFSELLVTLTASAKPDEGGLDIALFKNSENLLFAPIFTQTEAAQKWQKEGGQYASLKGKDLFKLLEGSPAELFVINPGSPIFAVLNRIDIKQISLGVVPQTIQSPVQGTISQSNQIQIAFPPNAFSEEQKKVGGQFLRKQPLISAAAMGAILPPEANAEDGWVRTIFVKTKQEISEEEVKKVCKKLQTELQNSHKSFKDFAFEIGVMIDPSFWQAVAQNKVLLFDKGQK